MLVSEMLKGKKYADKPVWLHDLNKDGSESGMNTARTYFDDEERAIEHHKSVVKLNPHKVVQHMLYSNAGDLGLYRVKLVAGKTVPTEQIKPAHQQFHNITSFQDEMLATFGPQVEFLSMWMEERKWAELMKFYNIGVEIKMYEHTVPLPAVPAANCTAATTKWIKDRQAFEKKQGFDLFYSKTMGSHINVVFVKGAK